MGVLGVQVVHSLLPRPIEQGGRLAKRPVTKDLVGPVLPGQDLILNDAGVELEVDLVVAVAGVGGIADVLVLAVRVSGVVSTRYRGAACKILMFQNDVLSVIKEIFSLSTIISSNSLQSWTFCPLCKE